MIMSLLLCNRVMFVYIAYNLVMLLFFFFFITLPFMVSKRKIFTGSDWREREKEKNGREAGDEKGMGGVCQPTSALGSATVAVPTFRSQIRASRAG